MLQQSLTNGRFLRKIQTLGSELNKTKIHMSRVQVYLILIKKQKHMTVKISFFVSNA